MFTLTAPPERTRHGAYRYNRQNANQDRWRAVAAVPVAIRRCTSLSHAGFTAGARLVVQPWNSAPRSFGFGTPQRFKNVGHEWPISVSYA